MLNGTNVTESWNGSAWTSRATMNTARGNGAGAGTQAAGLGFAGNQSPKQQTEEFTFPVETTATFTVS